MVKSQYLLQQIEYLNKDIVKEEVEYMQMKGKNLFDFAKGATFLLNPYSDYGKEWYYYKKNCYL